ncbi:MAG: phosphoenolpyruvate synthase [Gammaproteobacteria bacterium]|nr:MAG: phosphoenolpyruvate synthase [Gammaproteobacteria bacterium]
MSNVVWFEDLGISDVSRVGGKNASLGEMLNQLSGTEVMVPNGFATTVTAYQAFLGDDELDQKINAELQQCDVNDVTRLAASGRIIREWISAQALSQDLVDDIRQSYETLTQGDPNIAVAVRSSATAEDLPDASFAGQQETFLNICGLDNVLVAVKEVFASLFNDRAISYREHQGYQHHDVALSVGIQRMVRSDEASSGVMFTLDTETGFRDVVFLTASYGLGEAVVQGAVNPDEFYVHKATLEAGRPAILRRNMGSKTIKMINSDDQRVGKTIRTVKVEQSQRFKFSISDEEIHQLSRAALVIEKHYGQAMDIEWAKDSESGDLFIVQARPETVKSQDGNSSVVRYLLKENGKVLAEGRSVGQKIGSGAVRIINHIDEMHKISPGDVLVTDMTDPDWEPIMKIASAVVTNRGGRTCHAAIIARELGIPAVVGCADATDVLTDGQAVTVCCAVGDTGYIYQGQLEFDIQKNTMASMPEIPFKIMMNVANPDRAFDFQALPHAGVGLARLEFIINRMIGIHPKALLNYDTLPADTRKTVNNRISGYPGPIDFYVEKLVEGISTLAAAFSPEPVIVRLSDFKSNEYANLIGGKIYEPNEENPMLGFRGASRYISDRFRDCFELECRALKKVRDEMGFDNVQIMVPFVRTLTEAQRVVELLADNGLVRGKNGLKVIMMCELPTNALLADQFLKFFDGFSIGSNDLTQLTLGLDRDSGIVDHLFDERDPAVKALLKLAIDACNKADKYIGICGQGPSDHPDFAKWLVEVGIDSISLSPDSVLDTWFYLAEK